MKKKIIILHDTFLYKGGGERLILMMWKILGADIASGFFSVGSFDLRAEWFTGKMIEVSSEVFTKWIRHLKLKWSFLFQTSFLKEYEVVIFSGDSISAVRNCKKDTKKVYYCHTPPRYIYDLHELYYAKVPFFMKPFFKGACFVFRYLYEKDISKMDLILTNSKNTQARIKKFLWYESIVLYPPVDMTRFIDIWNKGYFLSFARLADAKRVDRIVMAFKKIPEEKLIIIYGKNDPQKQKIFDLAAGSKNIELVTLENNNDLYEYIGYARATIYIPIDEDFWMSPVESMSAWKPVLWVNEWWLKESILHKKTWYLVWGKAEKHEIIDAVKFLSSDKCETMKWDCIQQAANFSLCAFEIQLKSHI